MLEDNIPDISPASCFFHNSAIKIGEGQKTANIAKKSFEIISLVCTFAVVVLSSIPGESTFQQGLEIIIFSIKVVEMELKLGKGVMGLHMSKGSGGSNFVGKIHLDRTLLGFVSL